MATKENETGSVDAVDEIANKLDGLRENSEGEEEGSAENNGRGGPERHSENTEAGDGKPEEQPEEEQPAEEASAGEPPAPPSGEGGNADAEGGAAGEDAVREAEGEGAPPEAAGGKSGGRRMPEPDLEGPDEPDVLLDVPEVSVDEIDLKVDDLDARLALHAKVADLVEIQAGVDIHLGAVELNINGVMAEAHLQVDLDNVAEIVKEAVRSLTENPEVVRELGKTARRAAENVGDAAGEALGEGGAVTEVADSAGEAVEDVGEGAGGAVEDVGEGAGGAVEDVGEGAGEAAKEVGEGAGEAAADVGEGAAAAAEDAGAGAAGAASSAGEAAEEAAESAGEAASDVGKAAEGAAGEATEAAGEKEVVETASDASEKTERAAGAAEESSAGRSPERGEGVLDGVLDEDGMIVDDALEDAIDLAIEGEVIERRGGSWYGFEGNPIGQGHEAIVSWLRENGDIREVVSQRLSDAFGPKDSSSGEEQNLISERIDENGRTVRRVRDPSGSVAFEYVLENGEVKDLTVVEQG